ncbi:MAG: hypothetical protein IPG85_12240 [Bacteroidetes bacterium]|nr:hypothetical protein [Bacteroidota bacterium]
MNRKIHFIAALLILFASCKVSKKPVSSTTKGTANQLNEKADAQKDLTLFFDAEKARLAGNNVVALKLYLEYVKKIQTMQQPITIWRAFIFKKRKSTMP